MVENVTPHSINQSISTLFSELFFPPFLDKSQNFSQILFALSECFKFGQMWIFLVGKNLERKKKNDRINFYTSIES